MKATVVIRVSTTYDDGAGKTCVYGYPLASSVFAYLAKQSWRLRSFELGLPTSEMVITADYRAIVVSTPPAAGTRTITVAPAGVFSFIDAHEVITDILMAVTLSEVEEGAYDISEMIPSVAGLETVAGDLSTIDGDFTPHAFSADADHLSATGSLSNVFATAKKLPMLTIIVAEHDLVTREYTGMYGELVAKALVSAIQVAAGSFEGLAAQAVTYLQSGNSPMALELSLTRHIVKVGA